MLECWQEYKPRREQYENVTQGNHASSTFCPLQIFSVHLGNFFCFTTKCFCFYFFFICKKRRKVKEHFFKERPPGMNIAMVVSFGSSWEGAVIQKRSLVGSPCSVPIALVFKITDQGRAAGKWRVWVGLEGSDLLFWCLCCDSDKDTLSLLSPAKCTFQIPVTN